MYKLPIFEHFLSVSEYQAKMIFQAKIQAKIFLLNRALGHREEGLSALAGPRARRVRQDAPDAQHGVGVLSGHLVSFASLFAVSFKTSKIILRLKHILYFCH